jgi:hypothetical protein
VAAALRIVKGLTGTRGYRADGETFHRHMSTAEFRIAGLRLEQIKQKETPNSKRLREQRAFARHGRHGDQVGQAEQAKRTKISLRSVCGSNLCFLRYLLFKICACE